MTQEQFNVLIAMIEAIVEDKEFNDVHSAIKKTHVIKEAYELLVEKKR
jgi:hypothetical protein